MRASQNKPDNQESKDASEMRAETLAFLLGGMLPKLRSIQQKQAFATNLSEIDTVTPQIKLKRLTEVLYDLYRKTSSNFGVTIGGLLALTGDKRPITTYLKFLTDCSKSKDKETIDLLNNLLMRQGSDERSLKQYLTRHHKEDSLVMRNFTDILKNILSSNKDHNGLFKGKSKRPQPARPAVVKVDTDIVFKL